MRARRAGFILLSVCLSAISCEILLVDAPAGTRQQNDQAPTESSGQLKKPLPSATLKKPTKQKIGQASPGTRAQEHLSNTLQHPAKEDATEGQKKARPLHRKGKGSKKAKTQAVITSRTDLTYHGILQDPSRYDPRHNRHTAGTPDPQTPELTHDHFQELDRNGDGKIDPVEKAFGRLDMDRDLSARHWQ
ncbi:MAG TPA: EF-hand domain-containing protein [Nitrospiraceae bacterium]|nr:EF-hand domain-containing protein [Nitrospiraceae bacterium]